MNCPRCQHPAAEKNAKFCSQCGFGFAQSSAGQPQQNSMLPVEEKMVASLVTQTTSALAKQPNEETKGNPKKKKKKKKRKKATKDHKGSVSTESDLLTSDLSDMSLIDREPTKEQGREASDSESSVSDIDEMFDSLQDQDNTPGVPCTGCPLDETADRPAHPPAPIDPASQEASPAESQPALAQCIKPELPSSNEAPTASPTPQSLAEGDPTIPPGTQNLGEVRQQTDLENKKDAVNSQRTRADQNTGVDQNANLTVQIKQETQQAQQSQDTQPGPAGDQNMVFGPQKKTKEKKKEKKNENKGPKSLEFDQITSDLSDISLNDRKRKKEQGTEASDGEKSTCDMLEMPDSRQDQGKTPEGPCTGCPSDETATHQAHPPGPIGPASQEASLEESQPALGQSTKPEQPSSNEAPTASPTPPSQAEGDPTIPPGTQNLGGVGQQTDSKSKKGKKDAANSQWTRADQNGVDQNANVTVQTKKKTQQAQQSQDTQPGPAANQKMVFGQQKNAKQSKEQASSRTSSETDPKVEQEQLQKKSSTSKEDPSKGKEIDTDTKDIPPPKRMPPANEQIPASEKLTIYFHAVLSKDFKFNPDCDKIFLQAGERIGSWDNWATELAVSRDLGEHGFFVEGKLMTTKTAAASVSIPYKYVVYKHNKGKHEFEFIYKGSESRQPVNRCLFVKGHLLNDEGEWHQYDDIICVAPPQSFLAKGLAWLWSKEKKNVIQGREIAGKIMLGTIFDLLRSWNDINLKSFVTQLNQFHQIYANPFVYEETQKKRDDLEYGEKEVNLLLKQFVLENVTPQLGTDSSGKSNFITDPLNAAVIVLYIWYMYNIRLNNGELCQLCTALCLPERPKDDFNGYWANFVVSFSQMKLADMVLELVNRVYAEGMPHWILAVPLLHFLRGSSVPFEPVLRTVSTKFVLSWAGLEGLRASSNAYKSGQDRRAMINKIKSHQHLLEVDALLARSWMWMMTVEELVDCCLIAQVGLLDILQAFHLKAPAEVHYSSCSHVSDVLTHIQKSLVEQKYSLQSEDYGRACLKTAVELLDKICRGVKSSGYRKDLTDIPLACVNIVSLVLEFFLSCQPQESTEVGGAKMKVEDRELLREAMGIMRRWVCQTFQNRLTTGYMQIGFTSEIEMWNNVISLSFKDEEFTKEWRQMFTTDFEGKFERESPLDQIEIYCSSFEGIAHLNIANSIEKCALQAVNSICQDKAEAKLFEKIKINWKFGKLVTAIIEKSWPRDAMGHFLEGEEVILRHMLKWTAARDIFKLHGVDEKLTDKLSDEARERMVMASSAFTSISQKILTGAIEIKLLNQILENQRTFIELMKIDCLSDSERCKDSSAMRRLLQWRWDEVKAVYHERELVASLISMSQKLQEHIAVSMGNLEEMLQKNIEVMTLDQLIGVQQFDSLSHDKTGVVTFFDLDENTAEMAKVLCMLKDSFIFCTCWENQAKELSRRSPHSDSEDDDEDDYIEDFVDAEEQGSQLVATPSVIYSDIYQPSYKRYQNIYSNLKGGALKLGEVDVIFKDYEGKYEELRVELEIMCRTDRSEERNWIQRRVGQIEQYHEVHLAVKSAQVIKKVKDTLCLQGDFKVLDLLLEVADVNFKKESLDRIDNNLIQAKRDMVEITEKRLLCLQELGERKNFVIWVKEALEDINELKVFVDLASISAGENDLDVDRVACFHDAVLGYSPMLYELKPNSGFDVFKAMLKKLWKALDNDHNLPKKLRDTARHLEWLKTVKDSHGSVELSSLSLASAINKKGIYIISALNQKKLSLETALKLKIPEEHEEGQEMRYYSLEELRELQNKLMLMSGKGEQGQGEVEHFVEVFSGIQRLTVAFVDLYAAGNPLFRHWEANINCSTVNGDGMAGISMHFNLNTAVDEIMLEGDMLEQLLELCRKMEQCLDFWKAFVDQQRSQHYYLNYFSAEQIVYLCDRLTQKKVEQLDGQALMMLSFIKPNCGVQDLRQTWHELQYKLLTVAPEQDEDIDFQSFVGKTNSTEVGSTFEEVGADLPSLVEQTCGSRKLDVVWNTFRRDMQSFLPDSLDVRTLGKLLEILANQEEDDDTDSDEVEELVLSERTDKTVSRTFPNGLVCGHPNLVICPRAEVLKSCISVYMNSWYEPLPTYDEVLLCTSATPYEQVELFLRRCLTAGHRDERIYTLLHAEDLAYESSHRVEQLFQRLEKQSSMPYRLVIICSADREHAYIPSAFSQYRLHMVPLESQERIQQYLSWHYSVPSELPSAAAVFRDRKFVRVVTSKRAGVGKSLYVQRLFEKLEKTNRRRSLLKCIRLIEPRVDENVVLQSLISRLQKKELTIFHFDITSSVQKGLCEFLFKLLVLRYLMDSEGRMWKCSNTHLYVIEILQFTGDLSGTGKRARSHAQFAFLDVFPKVFCRAPKEVLDLEMRMRDDPSIKDEDPLMDDQEFRSEAFQRPYQYLTRFHNGTSLDNFMYKGIEGTHVQCLQILFVYCGIVDPSWAELRNFAWFLNLQLRDCETSVFCQMDFVGDTLLGFKNFVVDFMILMAKDFATPSLSISDQSPGRQLVDLAGATEADLAPFRIRKRWESEPHPYIFFNDDHISMTFIGFHLKLNEQNLVDAIDPLRKTVIKRNIMSRELYEGLKLQRVPFNTNFDQLPRDKKIECLCNVLGIQWPMDPDETYELTTDNILKMLAIHIRFRCGIPVIIMGETGCGKTRLVKYLCELQRSGVPTENMKLVKVHGGTTSDMIYAKVREADNIALLNKQEYSFDSILFFDEANTTEAVSSIKEVLCDGTVKGQPLARNTGLHIIAACNPYRKHSDEMIKRLETAGLGYRVRAEETDDKLGSIPLRQLVYRVQALPPSMIPLVWDFGQLNDCTEKMYIQQIVQRVVDTNAINTEYIEMITNVLSTSQKYMRTRKDECSFVSLRDVERCMQAFVWFYKKHTMLLRELKVFLDGIRNPERSGRMDPVEWSLVMAVGVCYHACLENKDNYRKRICKLFPETNTPQKVAQEISLMQDLFLSGFPLGETIARNNALKENVFMMVICIELRIPLFLVGKPGSSKSLSKTLVADAMQGQAAHSDLYKKLKQIHLVSFQCSPHSTPEGIINTFKQCARFQEGKNLREYISVVVLDEIGLAEDSPKMPLKTLHPLLEEGCIDDEPLPHKKVGFIGISNWALDPAKMNRGIFVSRGDPDEKELIESAKGICSSDKMVLEKVRSYFQPFARAYLNVCRKQGKGFFGLRDYYSLIKMVFAIAKVSTHEPSPERLVEAVLRNFSGKDNVDAVKVFISRLDINPSMESISAIELVRQNISAIGQDDECRYLLVLTKNYAALQILQQKFFSDQHQPEIIFGSSFPKDQEYTQICRNINRVKICMETGQTIVLLNLQNLYESLYDALNQYYVCLGGQKYVDLGLGTHRVKCRVHKDFRLIVIEEKEVVYKQFPIPLINRLEKHYLDINTVLKSDQKGLVLELEKWVERFVTLRGQHSMGAHSHAYLRADVFIGYHSDTCASVVLQVTEKLKEESEVSDYHRQILDEAKMILLGCATPDSVVRLDSTALPRGEIDRLAQVYFEKQKHSSLADFIISHTQQEERCHSSFTEVTTFSRLLTASDTGLLQEAASNIELLSLQQFDTEHSFLKKIRHFLDSTEYSGYRILIIQTDFNEGSQSANLIASAKYSAMNEISKSRNEDMRRKVFVYFITKIPRMEGRTSYVGFHGGPWKSVHIDDLRRSKDIISDIKALRGLTISQLFEDKVEEHDAMEGDNLYTATEVQEIEHSSEHSDGWEAVLDTTVLVRSCVQSAVGMLRDPGEGGARSTRRVEILLTLLADDEELKAAFLTTLKRRLHTLLVSYDGKSFSSKHWVINEASNVDALQEGGTFRHALWKRVQAVVTPLLAQLVAVADRDCNLDLLLDRNSGDPVRKLWLNIFRDEKLLEVPFTAVDRNSESKTILVQSYMVPRLGAGCSLPFSWRVRDYLEELWVHAQQHEGHTVRQFEDFFRQTSLGRYIAEAAEETQREFFQRYLQDFVCMTMKVASEEELQLLCTAMTCCVNELRIREDVTGDEVICLPWVHAAHQEFKNRLQNLSRMIAMEPEVALHLLRIEGSCKGPEMVLDVFAALACVELLQPGGLGSDTERLAWLRRVKRLQGPVELACSEEVCSRYGERSRERARTVRCGWSRIFSLSLFVEHLLVGIEGVEDKLHPLLLEHARVLGQVLEANSDLKMEPPFMAVIGILKACMDGANDRIFKFGRQPCPVCMGDPHDPLSLPCDHIYCLACIRQWLIPGQMYCPLCKMEIPDDFALTSSEDIRRRIDMYSQLRKRCNAFFIDLVSTVCFKDDAPPSSEVIRHLLSYLMVAVESVRVLRAHPPVFTKALSPFDDSVDKNPIVRSVILKLLLKYSFDEVKGYLQQHLIDVERSNVLDEGDKSELCSLYINCLQDSMVERTECRSAAERAACLQDEGNFLKHFLKHFLRPRGGKARASTIEHLQEVARVRLCLDMAAHLLVERQTNPGPGEGVRNGVSVFLGRVAELCAQSGNDWYRVYLIRRVCGQQGVEFIQKLQTMAELRWLFPKELLQNQEEGQMDHFLVWGEDYRTVREAVAKAAMKDGAEGIEEACEKCAGSPAKKTVILLLALFREVTTLYRTADCNLHPKQKLLQAMEGYIQGSRVLVAPEARAFALALVQNRLGALSVTTERLGPEHGLVELTIHLAAVLMCANRGCLAPLLLLAQSPAHMQAAFLPTMPEDMFAVARAALGHITWYYCPNGHPCTVGECGQPMEVRRCLDCNLPIGGIEHRPVQGFNPVTVQEDRTQTGHVLGDPQRRDMPDMLDTKSMSPAPFTLVRLLTHMSMLIGASEHPQVIAQIIKPPVADLGSFLIGHLLKDMGQLGRMLGKGSDDTVSVAHLTVLSLLEANRPARWHVPHGSALSTKEARNAWEMGVASDIIVPHLKTLDRRLNEANALIRMDSRVSSSPIMRLVFGDPRLTLTALPRDSPIHSGAVWSSRERVSLRGLAHVVEQNDGRDALPVLWRFLHKEAELRLVRFLPDILALQKELVKKFQNSPDGACSTIHEFIQSLKAASLKAWYETRIKIFLKTWNQLRQSLATKGELKIPADLCQADLDLSSDLQVLLPRRQGQGLCATALVSYLIALHNEQVHAVDKHTGEETSYTVSPADLSDLHVVRYEPERDLHPLVLSHCQYSVERGQETLSEYDLPKIQQQVVTRFLQGKPLISLVGIPTLVNRQDRNYVNIFKDVKEKVGQEALPALTLAALAGELAAYSDVCEALAVVEVALGFLAMTGENPDMQLVCYLRDILQMGDQTAPHILKALSRCSLKHCAALWQLLASLKSENMLRLKRDPFAGVSGEYKEALSEEERGLLMGFLSKGSADACLLEMHEFLLLHLKGAQAPNLYRASWGLKETMESYIERKEVDVPPDVELLPTDICLSKFVEAWKLIAAFRQDRGRR